MHGGRMHRRTRDVLLFVLVVVLASFVGPQVIGQGGPGGLGGANRAPAHEWSGDLAMKITEPFTLASVGDVIIIRPASKSSDPGVQGALKILHDADAGFGNF